MDDFVTGAAGPGVEFAGPGAIEDQGEAPKPVLEGASEYEVVVLYNPLSVAFKGLFGMTRPVRAQITISSDPRAPGATRSEADLRSNYGLDLQNPDHTSKASIQNTVTIEPGGTIRLLGNEAQVVLRQLVNEVMQRRGQRLMLADPFARHQVEQELVKDRRSVNEILDQAPRTVSEQLQEAKREPEEFPGLAADQTADQADRTDERTAESVEKRSPGRPKKTE